jgi:hypothetical protein
MKNRLTAVLLMAFLSFKLAAQSHSTKPSTVAAGEVTITIMPNPIKNTTVIFKLEGLKNKPYTVKIISDKGGIAATDRFNSPTATTFRMIQLEKKFKGYGRVQLLDETGRVVGQSRFLVLDN